MSEIIQYFPPTPWKLSIGFGSLTQNTTTNPSSLLLLSAGINELDAYCCFIPNTSKALPITLEKKLFGTRVRSWWVCPLVPAAGHLSGLILSPQTQQEIRSLLSVYPHISVAVQMESRGTWHLRWCVADPPWGITLFQWQQDIIREITNLWDAHKEMLA